MRLLITSAYLVLARIFSRALVSINEQTTYGPVKYSANETFVKQDIFHRKKLDNIESITLACITLPSTSNRPFRIHPSRAHSLFESFPSFHYRSRCICARLNSLVRSFRQKQVVTGSVWWRNGRDPLPIKRITGYHPLLLPILILHPSFRIPQSYLCSFSSMMPPPLSALAGRTPLRSR